MEVMSRLLRFLATSLVLACLTAGAAQALPVRPAFAVPEAGSMLDAAWSWLVSRLRPAGPAPRQAGATPSQQQKYGCGMDPDGKPLPCIN
jgi:hypothetical protein